MFMVYCFNARLGPLADDKDRLDPDLRVPQWRSLFVASDDRATGVVRPER